MTDDAYVFCYSRSSQRQSAGVALPHCSFIVTTRPVASPFYSH